MKVPYGKGFCPRCQKGVSVIVRPWSGFVQDAEKLCCSECDYGVVISVTALVGQDALALERAYQFDRTFKVEEAP